MLHPVQLHNQVRGLNRTKATNSLVFGYMQFLHERLRSLKSVSRHCVYKLFDAHTGVSLFTFQRTLHDNCRRVDSIADLCADF